MTCDASAWDVILYFPSRNFVPPKVPKGIVWVGIIKNIHGNPADPKALFDVKFCPPKGAKPQKGKRPDTLYQDIRADMKFNTSYTSKTGKKIESEDCKLEKDVFLAFNLTLKKDGTFGGTIAKLRDGKYNITSQALASHVIELFYLERDSAANK